MGAPARWIKALMGLKKSEKSPSPDKVKNVGIHHLSLCVLLSFLSLLAFLTYPRMGFERVIFHIVMFVYVCVCFFFSIIYVHRSFFLVPSMCQKNSNSKSRHRRRPSVDVDDYKLEDEFDSSSVATFGDGNMANAAGRTPPTSFQVQQVNHDQKLAGDEWAAIHIQTAFRGFLVLEILLYILLALCIVMNKQIYGNWKVIGHSKLSEEHANCKHQINCSNHDFFCICA